MPKVSVWLPVDLHGLLEDHHLSPSELLQDALRRHVDETGRRAALDELLASMDPLPDDDPQWAIWADETLREHLERRPS